MQISLVQYLFVLVALVPVELSYAENLWSGFVNSLQSSFDYQCPDSLAITGVASVFDDPVNDRRWEFSCGSGGSVANVSSSCTLQSPVHSLRSDITFECSDEGYISGFQSTYSPSDEDRLWSPYCCTRNYSTLVNCHILTSNWENILEDVLNWTTSSNRVLTGMTSFFSSFNRDRRWRFKQCQIQVSCGDPGVPENAVREGERFLYQDTVIFTCNNGYYQSSGDRERICQDTGLWSGIQPACTLCTNIENCADIRCTDPADQYCFECESNHGVALGESGYRNLNSSCEPYCSWLRAFCYPGVCPAGPSSCNCSDGFSGPDCLQIDAKPDLESCHFTVSSLTTDCSLNQSSVSYINFAPDSLTGDWETLFNGPSPPPVRPAYIQDYAVGIVQSRIEATVFRQDSYPTDPASSTEHTCSNVDLSPDTPKATLVNCHTSVGASALVNHTFLHGDWFKLAVFIINGGYLNVTDLDTNDTSIHYYSGSAITPFSLLVIDTHPPAHCSVVPSETCLANQEILQESLVHNSLTMRWGGWSDSPAGLSKYRIEIYELVYSSDTGLLDRSPSIDYSIELIDDGRLSYTTDYSLSAEGPYSIVLISTDQANNRQFSRRIIVYDVSSELVEDTAVPLVVANGYGDSTSGYWHNSTTTPIVVSGRGHFYNTLLNTSNWLAPVANHTPNIPVEYDDSDRHGVPNALGITELAYTFIIDQQGGTSPAAITQPDSFPHRTDDLALAGVEVTPPVNDGDSVSIWFEARDYRRNSPVYEKILVHIDSSPPVIEGLGLRREGVSDLIALHGTDNLLDLNIVFSALDEESGLYELNWRIRTDSLEIAQGQLAIYNYSRDTCAIDPDCLCDSVNHCHKMSHSISLTLSDFHSSSEAKHDTDYYVVVTATNHAHLSATLTHQFTVDLTPPLVGGVFDGSSDSSLLDIDYSREQQMITRWSGFFDRETGILTYQYIIDTQCATAGSFLYPPSMGSSPAIATNETIINWVAPSVGGRYHVTVVAYNGAYQMSKPVCSDGVTIDVDPPLFRGVAIPGGVVREGLVRSSIGEVWLVHANRERSLVSGSEFNESCLNGSTFLSNSSLSTFPIKYEGSSPRLVPAASCYRYSPFTDVVYTPIDYALNVTWSVVDGNGIRDYQIGVASQWDHSNDPDVVPLQSTAGHAHYSLYSPSLGAGARFFIVLKAIDLALHETVVTVGPIIIDVSSPVANGSITTDALSGGLYLVSWERESFYDNEDIFPLKYEYAIGRSPYGTDVLNFTPLVSSAHSLHCLSHHCIVIATESLNFQSGNDYHVTLKVINSGNLATYVPVDPYTVPFPLPECLTVFDYETSNNPFICDIPQCSFNPQSADVDIIFDSTSVSVGWKGLDGQHLNASFSVAIGTRPGWTDVIDFVPVNTGGVFSHTFVNLSLIPGTQYYATVRATNKRNTLTISSDGFLVLSSVFEDNKNAFIWDGWSDSSDIDYQLSSTVAAAHWYYPDSISRHLSHFEWALFRAWDRDVANLTAVLDFVKTGHLERVTSLVNLQPGVLYISAVRACFKQRCLEPKYSDGFYLATPPLASQISAEYYRDPSLDHGQLHAMWTPFQDPELNYYQWSIGSGKGVTNLITTWQYLSPNVSNISLPLALNISYRSLYYLNLRGFNKAGLETKLSTEIAVTTVVPSPQVFDIDTSSVTPLTTDNWRKQEFRNIIYEDLDYTNSHNSLAAAWPDLRYTRYSYSISTNPYFVSCTDSPPQTACGSTIANSISVNGLELAHGEMYYFCVQGLAEDFYGPRSSEPQTTTVCSDGIVADLAPPLGGCVQIVLLLSVSDPPELMSGEREESGDQLLQSFDVDRTHSCSNQSGSQSSTSELHIVWDWFQDIENGTFAYGIANYEYSIGTSAGGQEIAGFISVGVVREVLVTGLSLTSGLTYYATVRATDHTGQQTVVTSKGINIDNTPPIFRRVWLNTPTSTAINSPQELRPNWDLIIDTESDVAGLYWALGSSAGLSDISPFTQTDSTSSLSVPVVNLTIPDGQPIVLTLVAINYAGLMISRSSRRVIFDSTPPCLARVFDGPRPNGNEYLDLDYTANHTHLSAHWIGFQDPHTDISRYYWAIGTCRGCTDILPFVTVGLWTEYTRKDSFSHGKTYYISVRGCSRYSGCTVGYSDGITVDATGPITSLLHHGVIGSLKFQTSRYAISCHWNEYPGFHDSQSKLSRYIYYVGTSPGDHTYTPPTTIPGSATSFTVYSPFLSAEYLPLNERVYVTLEVYNRAGLSHTVHSRGVLVTGDQGPVSVQLPYINATWAGSLVHGTQYTGSVVRAEWNYSDAYISVDQYFWTLLAEENTHQPFNGISYTNGFSLTNIDIQDGTKLAVNLVACNQAGICRGNISDTVLIDSTPPIDGYFSLNTSSAAAGRLPWSAISDGMNWYHSGIGDSSILNMTFAGFSDPHSGVSEYWAIVGSEYGRRDLFDGLSPLLVREHQWNPLVTVATVQLSQSLYPGQLVYVWLWAINGVGRESQIAQGTFEVKLSEENTTNSGTLELLRSQKCPIVSCKGHCTCNERGHLCDVPINSTLSCHELNPSSLSLDMSLNITSISWQQQQGSIENIPLFTAVTDKLSGLVQYSTDSPSLQWVEWSVSEINQEAGTGLIDIASDPVWFPLYPNTNRPIFDVTGSSHPLVQGKTYVIRVRAWFNATHFSSFVSDGVVIDSYSPVITSGYRVMEISNFGEMDYTVNTRHLTLNWGGVFGRRFSGEFLSYYVGIGDTHGSDNIYGFTLVGNITALNLTGLNLRGDSRYYTTVKAVNPLGITAISVSDGFLVDLTPPIAGAVFIGGRYHSNIAQADASMVSVRLLGFHDPDSNIVSFRVGIARAYETPETFVDVQGFNMRPVLSNLNLDDDRYRVTVTAFNTAGETVTQQSDVFIIDSTPPAVYNCSFVSLVNESFRSAGDIGMEFNATRSVTESGWIPEGRILFVYSSTSRINLPDGNRAIEIPHSISRALPIMNNVIYYLSFYVLVKRNVTTSFIVKFGDVYHRRDITNSDSDYYWQLVQYIYKPPAVSSSDELILSISSIGNCTTDNACIAVDDVVINYCQNLSTDSTDTIIPDSIDDICGLQLPFNVPLSDEDSGVKLFSYAAGTVKGGTQILPYTPSVDNTLHFDDLINDIEHNTSVYLTVLATNYAGLSKVFYSESIVIDKTPPVVRYEGVKEVTREGGVDVDYVNSFIVWADWSNIVDEESGIKFCQWGLGTAPGETDILSLRIVTSTSVNSSDLSSLVSEGTVVYSTVICMNNAGLSTVSHSDGVTLLGQPPTHQLASLSILSPAPVWYESQSGYLPSDSIQLIWNGFQAVSPLRYQVRITESGAAIGAEEGWCDMGSIQQLTLSGLNISTDINYTAQIRAYTVSGLMSQPVTANFSIVSVPPNWNQDIPLNVTWRNTNELLIEWKGVFTSRAPITYEVSLGSQLGSTSIRRWVSPTQETDRESIVINEPRLSNNDHYFLAVNAISANGLSVTGNYLIDNNDVNPLSV